MTLTYGLLQLRSKADDWTQHDVPETNGSVVTLKENRSRSGVIRREPTTSATFDRLVVDDPLSIQYDTDVSIHEGQVIAIPLSPRLCRL